MSELKQFRLPDVGEGLTEADIVKWHVKPGDRVTINQIIVEIETAKAVVELPCPFEGVVQELLVTEGATADVGTPIISVDVRPGCRGPRSASSRAAGRSANWTDPPADGTEPGMHGTRAQAGRQAVLVGYGVKLGATTRRARKPAATKTTTDINGNPGASHPAASERPAVLAKPPVRKLARDLGVDLSGLPAPARTARSPATSHVGPPVTSGRRCVPRRRPPTRGGRRRPGSVAARRGRRRLPGGADPGPRRPQAHRGGGGGERVHRAARHRVPADRHDRDDGRGDPAQVTARFRRRPAFAAALVAKALLVAAAGSR